MAITLTIEQKNGLFKELADKTLYEVALKYGYDKHYKTAEGAKGAVYRTYNEVKNNPAEFGISEDVLDLVIGNVSSRKIAMKSTSLKEKNEDLENLDIKDLVTKLRDKALKLAHRKMDRVGRSNASIDNINLATLMTAVGISFDKAQIIQGMATENVAVLATHIKSDMKPEEAIDYVLKTREINQAIKENHGKK